VIERAKNQWNGCPGLPMLAKVTTISALTSMMLVVSGCNANKSEAVKKAETVQEISVSSTIRRVLNAYRSFNTWTDRR
jgi:hypothetical protein